MVHVPSDNRLIQPNHRREQPRRPQHRAPVGLLQRGVPQTKMPTQIRFHLAHHARYRIFRRNHQPHMNMINLNAPVLDQHIRMIVLDLRSMFLYKDLDRPSQNASALFGDPHHMIVMRIRTMGTEANFHALMSSRTAHLARSPPPAAGSPFTHGLTPRGPPR